MIKLYSFNDFTLYISEEDYENFTPKNKIDMIDNEGYKYFLSKSNVSIIKRRKRVPARFFNLNPYTEDNIALYLKKETNNDICMLDFCNAQNAHDGILLYDSNTDVSYKKSWNEIKSGRYIRKLDYPDYENPQKLDINIIKNKLKEYNLTMIGEYVNNSTPIEFVCEKHKDKGVQKMNWANIKRSPCPCRYCSEVWHPKLSDEEFQKEVKERKNSNIKIIGKYTNANTKIECKCTKCGRTIFLRPDHIKRGIGCGYCTKSIGEDRVENFLKNHNIKYEREYRFKDCVRVQRPMPFDFYIPDKNTIIEFDGVQHFQVIRRFGGEESFTQTRLNDNFKTEYCKSKGINLVRISYKELDKIDEILSEKLINL